MHTDRLSEYMVQSNYIAETLRDASEEYGLYELGVFHIKKESESSDPFILVGVNPNNSDATEIFEEWKEHWSEQLEHVSTTEYDEENIDTKVHKYHI